MRILIHDFGRHAFAFQLSCELARRGYEVHHLSFADDRTPCDAIKRGGDAPSFLQVHAVSLPYPYYKGNFVLRKIQLMHYGVLLKRKIKTIQPDIVIASTTPPDVQHYMQQQCHTQNIPFIFWLQDLFGLAVYDLLRQKHWTFKSIGKHYIRLEKKLLQKSNAIICISEAFKDELKTYQLKKHGALHVVPNWGALPCNEVALKKNAWSEKQGLHDQCVFMYTGTLGLKHNADMLLALAKACETEKNMRLVIISEGSKVDKLRAHSERLGLKKTMFLPFQSDADFPLALASADVCLAILSKEAARFSVPSKILNYMSVGRAVLIAAPKKNQAVQMLLDAGAGIHAQEDDADAFVEQAKRLLRDPEKRLRMAELACKYAQQHFDIRTTANRFIDIMQSIRPVTTKTKG